MAFAVERLTKRHDRDAFDCGEDDLNGFLRRFARQNQTRGYGRTYVAVRPGDVRVLGFYTIASGSVAFEVLPEDARRRLPRYPVPVVHLARLGVDRSMQGQGLGGALLFDAFRRSLRVADELGVAAVEVAAKSEIARDFYLHHGFRDLEDDRFHLYLPLGVVRELVG